MNKGMTQLSKAYYSSARRRSWRLIREDTSRLHSNCSTPPKSHIFQGGAWMSSELGRAQGRREYGHPRPPQNLAFHSALDRSIVPDSTPPRIPLLMFRSGDLGGVHPSQLNGRVHGYGG